MFPQVRRQQIHLAEDIKVWHLHLKHGGHARENSREELCGVVCGGELKMKKKLTVCNSHALGRVAEMGALSIIFEADTPMNCASSR